MDFNLLLQKFNQENKASIIDAKYATYRIKWKFEDFPTILSKPTFITYLTKILNKKFTTPMIIAIENEIDFIRQLFTMTDEAATRYLGEIETNLDCANMYWFFLLNLYVEVKEFVSNHLISWVFDQNLEQSTFETGIEYDANLFYQFQKEKFKLLFQKQLRKIIQSITKILVTDQTFKLMDDQYEYDIQAKQLMLKIMKNKAKIEKREKND